MDIAELLKTAVDAKAALDEAQGAHVAALRPREDKMKKNETALAHNSPNEAALREESCQDAAVHVVYY